MFPINGLVCEHELGKTRIITAEQRQHRERDWGLRRGGSWGQYVPRARPPRASSEVMAGKGPNCSGVGQMAPRCYHDMQSGTHETRALSPLHRLTAHAVNEWH